MTQLKDFLGPRMFGKRFEDHTIDVHLLKNLSVLNDLVVSMAKWCYFQENPEKRRSPNGFTDGISIKLSGVDEGSAVPKFKLAIESPELVDTVSELYFFKARDKIFELINSAENDESIPENLPSNVYALFDRLGRGLLDDEGIEFDPSGVTGKATLTKASRRKLLFALSDSTEVTDEVMLYGTIPMVQQDKGHFEIQVINGAKITAPLDKSILDLVLSVTKNYQFGGAVLINGVASFSKNGRMERIESIDEIVDLRLNDVAVRILELKGLQDGWLDGIGIAPSHEGLNWLRGLLLYFIEEPLPFPYLYPTETGGVQAEWSFGSTEVSIEIDLHAKKGEWHAFNLEDDTEDAREIDLDSGSDWNWIKEQITELMEVQP